MERYSFVDVDELPGEGPGGAVKKLRRALGAHAFGFNYFELAPDAEGVEHDETESSQEEVMFVVAGSGRLRIDGDGSSSGPAGSSGSTRRLSAAPSRGPTG